MPYQNNNNRIVPDGTQGLTSITPETKVVNKEIKYKLDTDNQAALLGQSLRKLGQGIIDFNKSGTLQKIADENMMEAIMNDNKQGKQLHDFNEALKDMPEEKRNVFMRGFYKESYKKLAAKDYGEKFYSDLNSNPEYYKMTEQEYDKYMNDKITATRELMQNSGLETRQVAAILENMNTAVNQHRANYLVNNAKYLKQQTINKTISTGLTDLRNVIYHTPKSEQYTALKEGIQNIVQFSTEAGLTQDDIIDEVVYKIGSILPQQIGSDPNSTMDLASYFKVLSEVEVNGKKLSEIAPNFEYNVRQGYLTAKRQSTAEERMEYENEIYQDKINQDKAEKAALTYYIQNQDKPVDELMQGLNEITSQYGVDVTLPVLQKIGTKKSVLNSLNEKDVTSDENSLSELDRAFLAGELSEEKILNHWDKLNRTDRNNYIAKYLTQEKREEAAEAKQVSNAYKTLNNQIKQNLKAKSPWYTELNKASKQDAQDFVNAVTSIDNALAEGSITEAEAYRRKKQALQLAEYKMKQTRSNEEAKQVKKAPIKSPDSLMSAQYCRENVYWYTSNYNEKTEKEAYVDLDFTRGKVPTILKSGYNYRRKHPVTGKVQPHYGVDIAMPENTALYLPEGCTGVVISSSNNSHPEMGKWAMIKITNKKGESVYMKCFHLNWALAAGLKITRQTAFAKSGNTGKSSGAHLHSEFIDESGTQRLTAKEVENLLMSK